MGGTRFIVAGSFIDGSGGDVRRNVFLAVKDGIITAICPAADLPRHDGAAIDDFSHCVILPALVDCSVSLTRSPSVDRQVRLAAEEADHAEKAAMLERHISYCHAYGVLGVAASDDLTDLVDRYQKGMAQESIINIRTSGRLCRSLQEWATVTRQAVIFSRSVIPAISKTRKPHIRGLTMKTCAAFFSTEVAKRR